MILRGMAHAHSRWSYDGSPVAGYAPASVAGAARRLLK